MESKSRSNPTAIGVICGIVAGDLFFVLAGLMSAGFSTLLRLWRIAPMPAAAVIGVLSLFAMPLYWLHYGLPKWYRWDGAKTSFKQYCRAC